MFQSATWWRRDIVEVVEPGVTTLVVGLQLAGVLAGGAQECRSEQEDGEEGGEGGEGGEGPG